MPDGAETSHPDETSAKVLLLRRWSEMPRHLQFNPHILTGYRPLMTIRQCLGSLFYVHNETVNILTHGETEICRDYTFCDAFMNTMRLE